MAAPAPVREKPADAAHPPEGTPTRRIGAGLLDPQRLWRALPTALRKLNPVTLARNPVMFVTEIGVAMNTGVVRRVLFGRPYAAYAVPLVLRR
ncbi:hypothetical protein [Streptomyces aureus]|uniref:Uncharacterized protein n=1 Tax=Streptomyces aureus TaxID=193461 RepID=A0ABV4SYY8_9ACTN